MANFLGLYDQTVVLQQRPGLWDLALGEAGSLIKKCSPTIYNRLLIANQIPQT